MRMGCELCQVSFWMILRGCMDCRLQQQVEREHDQLKGRLGAVEAIEHKLADTMVLECFA